MFGGWRIVKTMGQKITKAQAGGRLLRRDRWRDDAVPRHRAGHPGLDHAHHHRRHRRRGSTQRASAVRWGVAGNIVWAWIFTIPASAAVAAGAYWGLGTLILWRRLRFLDASNQRCRPKRSTTSAPPCPHQQRGDHRQHRAPAAGRRAAAAPGVVLRIPALVGRQAVRMVASIAAATATAASGSIQAAWASSMPKASCAAGRPARSACGADAAIPRASRRP